VSLDTSATAQHLETICESLDRPSASVAGFVRWLRRHAEIDTSALQRRQLLTLYAEFCEYHDLVPLTPGRFNNSLASAGFRRRRLSTPGRPWVYFLCDPGADIRKKRSSQSSRTSLSKRGEP
jgi:hypothetical protein